MSSVRTLGPVALLLALFPAVVTAQNVRPATVAGTFYPAGAAELAAWIDDAMTAAGKIKSELLRRIDFFGDFNRIEGGKVLMKGFFKFLLAVVTLGGVFFLGLHLGKEKEKSKIPIFQEEPEARE